MHHPKERRSHKSTYTPALKLHITGILRVFMQNNIMAQELESVQLREQLRHEMSEAKKYLSELLEQQGLDLMGESRDQIPPEQQMFLFEMEEMNHYGYQEVTERGIIDYETSAIDAYIDLINSEQNTPWASEAKKTIQAIEELQEKTGLTLNELIVKERKQQALENIQQETVDLAKEFIHHCKTLNEALWKDDKQRERAITDLIHLAQRHKYLDYSEQVAFEQYVLQADENLKEQLENVQAFERSDYDDSIYDTAPEKMTKAAEISQLKQIGNQMIKANPQYVALVRADGILQVSPAEKQEQAWKMEIGIQEGKLRGRVAIDMVDNQVLDKQKLQTDYTDIYTQAEKLMQMAKEIKQQEKSVTKELNDTVSLDEGFDHEKANIRTAYDNKEQTWFTFWKRRDDQQWKVVKECKDQQEAEKIHAIYVEQAKKQLAVEQYLDKVHVLTDDYSLKEFQQAIQAAKDPNVKLGLEMLQIRAIAENLEDVGSYDKNDRRNAEKFFGIAHDDMLALQFSIGESKEQDKLIMTAGDQVISIDLAGMMDFKAHELGGSPTSSTKYIISMEEIARVIEEAHIDVQNKEIPDMMQFYEQHPALAAHDVTEIYVNGDERTVIEDLNDYPMEQISDREQMRQDWERFPWVSVSDLNEAGRIAVTVKAMEKLSPMLEQADKEICACKTPAETISIVDKQNEQFKEVLSEAIDDMKSQGLNSNMAKSYLMSLIDPCVNADHFYRLEKVAKQINELGRNGRDKFGQAFGDD